MAFLCKTPGGEVRLNDLTLEQLEQIESLVAETSTWVEVITAPAATMKRARAIYAVCCEVTGCQPETLTARHILDGEMFETVVDDMPDFSDTRETTASDSGSLDVDPKAAEGPTGS